jgi:hypothetical protein
VQITEASWFIFWASGFGICSSLGNSAFVIADPAHHLFSAWTYCGSGVGSLSPIGTAGRMTTPTGMLAFSMFMSWLTVTNW